MSGRYQNVDLGEYLDLLSNSRNSDEETEHKSLLEFAKPTRNQKHPPQFQLKNVYKNVSDVSANLDCSPCPSQYQTTLKQQTEKRQNTKSRKEKYLLSHLRNKSTSNHPKRQGDKFERKHRHINTNNNKKKSLLSCSKNNSNQTKERNESRRGKFTKPKLITKKKFAQNRRSQSFQLSSIRVLPTPRKKLFAWSQKNVEYGKRIIAKDGTSNVQVSDPESRIDLYSRYVNDIFTTLLDSSWAWVLSITTTVYIVHWLLFGLIYWIFALLNEDYLKIGNNFENKTSSNTSMLEAEDPCIHEVYDGITAFLFSLESETTIGYGFRTITTSCPGVVLCLTIQCVVSAVFDTWVIGMCFARLARPDARTKTTLFSRNAVICKRDGKRCLLVRFSNLRKSLLLNVSVTGRLITWRGAHGKEKNAGYQRVLEQCQITFQNESTALLTAPIEYCHVIDISSPFYDFSAHQFNSPDGSNYFELICIVTGTLESTGLTMQAQTSYLSSEVLYGHRFAPVIAKCLKKNKYVANFQAFHDTTKEPAVTMRQKRKHLRFCKSEPILEEDFYTNQNTLL